MGEPQCAAMETARFLGLPTQNSYIDAAHGILQFIMPTLQVAAFVIAAPVDKTTRPLGKRRVAQEVL